MIGSAPAALFGSGVDSFVAITVIGLTRRTGTRAPYGGSRSGDDTNCAFSIVADIEGVMTNDVHHARVPTTANTNTATASDGTRALACFVRLGETTSRRSVRSSPRPTAGSRERACSGFNAQRNSSAD